MPKVSPKSEPLSRGGCGGAAIKRFLHWIPLSEGGIGKRWESAWQGAGGAVKKIEVKIKREHLYENSGSGAGGREKDRWGKGRGGESRGPEKERKVRKKMRHVAVLLPEKGHDNVKKRINHRIISQQQGEGKEEGRKGKLLHKKTLTEATGHLPALFAGKGKCP